MVMNVGVKLDWTAIMGDFGAMELVDGGRRCGGTKVGVVRRRVARSGKMTTWNTFLVDFLDAPLWWADPGGGGCDSVPAAALGSI